VAQVSAAAEIEAAYARCEAITRREAANFYYGIRLLSRERRRAMCAVYAFARRVDDIGDGELPAAGKLAALEQQSRALARLAGGPPGDGERTGALPAGQPGGDATMVALADARTHFPLPLDALQDLIEGVRMDIDGVAYESFEQLVLYCRRVAGAIGRVCLAIFGLRESERGAGDGRAELERASRLADDLGVALQLTNILRDVREDAGNGRVYLPGEDLRRFGLPGSGNAASALMAALDAAGSGVAEHREALDSLVGFEAARAREWFERGMTLTEMLDRRSAACVLAMAGIYRRLLERIDADPARALSERMSLPAHEKALVAVRGLLGVSP
jgi:15-cis-phytoene synthase